jgi:hypothetical protein
VNTANPHPPPATLNVFVYLDSSITPPASSDPLNPLTGLSNRYMDERDYRSALIFWLPFVTSTAETERLYSGFAQIIEQVRAAGVGVEFVLQGE